MLPNGSYVQDLGALLPAVGAAGEAAQAASSGRMSGEAAGWVPGGFGFGLVCWQVGRHQQPSPETTGTMHVMSFDWDPVWLLLTYFTSSTVATGSLPPPAPAASLSVADMSLDALQSAQEEDLLTLKLFRWGAGGTHSAALAKGAKEVRGLLCHCGAADAHLLCSTQAALMRPAICVPTCRQLWLYVGVYDFAGLQGTSQSSGALSGGDRWPAEWRAALGRVAVATPLLIVGWEQFKPDEMLESLTSEFASRLTKLGAQGSPPALMAALQASLGGALGPQLPGPLVCGTGVAVVAGSGGGLCSIPCVMPHPLLLKFAAPHNLLPVPCPALPPLPSPPLPRPPTS